MLAYDIKAILEIVPEATALVKKANLEQEFPVETMDSYIASVLRFNYLTKVAKVAVDYDAYGTLEKAAAVYNIENELKPFIASISAYASNALVKSASEFNSTEEYSTSSAFQGMEKTAQVAAHLYEIHGADGMNDDIKKYAGVGYLDKEAAVGGMISRYQASKDERFVKLARIINDTDETTLLRADLMKIASTVLDLEKENELQYMGFNFFEESIVKSAASVLLISLAGAKVPYEKIARLGKDRIASVLGKDVAEGLTNDPVNDKHVLESLPLDLQRILASLLKSV